MSAVGSAVFPLPEKMPLQFDLSPDVVELIRSYVPFSFFAYFALLAVAFVIRQVACMLCKCLTKIDTKKLRLVPQPIEFVHNIFLTLQSAYLIMAVYYQFYDTARLAKLDPIANFLQVLLAPERTTSRFFEWTMFAFLMSKIYETLDTVILILNGKPTIMLHVWHHATTYIAFFTGHYTGAYFWIGVLNSAIHVVMYLYYAKVPGIKPIAKYITSTQIFHLFGGAVLNGMSLMNPLALSSVNTEPIKPAFFVAKASTVLPPALVENTFGKLASVFPTEIKIDCVQFSILNCCICLSYFLMFLAFFAKKYKKTDADGAKSAKKNK
eukprot:gnl/TRDRNA2_/TRDRNA2_177270_c0_seq4.p1 gnl/TRDRNA2_/TRDRNA2_177270_c0~~gnl/TRDRNA2_/TRDRNA2_177270_c0_seq4.p1  ORF type:complete len:324 (-),score=67.18 gnl/TRDRNA2_/TRDRNA2_177270_c0_seq4:245-1216(-)